MSYFFNFDLNYLKKDYDEKNYISYCSINLVLNTNAQNDLWPDESCKYRFKFYILNLKMMSSDNEQILFMVKLVHFLK